uniref:Wrapper n=1 Tax=Daphnia magna TaxID=35525 RepID=A0A0P5XLQ1_9CRUS
MVSYLHLTVVAFSVFVAAVVVLGAPADPLTHADEFHDDFEAADDGTDDYDEEEEMGSSFKKPNFTSAPQHFRVRMGDSVRLSCEVDELGPGYTLLWKREEGDILTAGSVLIVKDTRISHEGNSLIIRNISMADQGSYICQISTQDQRELRHIIDILVPPSVKPVPSTGLAVVKKGEPVTLSCEVTGNPLPVVTWTREGAKKFPDGQRTMLGHMITFVKTDRHHSGVYTCTAENSEGSPAKGVINLEITYEPEIEVELNLVTIAEGYNTELTCTVHGEPKPNVFWTKNEERLDSTSGPHSPHHRYVQTSTGSRHVLSIDNVQSHDFANYTCHGENRFGRDHKTIEMTGVASTATLKRNKPLTNGVELEWVTVSHTPLMEYRLRYRRPSASHWEELLLKANEQDSEQGGMLFNHVHQLHGLASATEHELTIESKNKFGWSRPLHVEFTTLPEGGSDSTVTEAAVHEAGRVTSAARQTSWSVVSATIVLTLAAILC